MSARNHVLGALIAAAATAAHAAPAPAALLLRYTFDETNGSAVDTGAAPAASGTFNTASIGRSTDTPSGSGRAMITPGGTNDYVTAGDADKLDGLTQFTLTTWVNLGTTPSTLDRIVSKHSTAGAGFEVWFDVSGSNIRLRLSVDGSDAPISGTALTTADLGEWAFLAITYDGTSTTNNVSYYATATATEASTNVGVGTLDKGAVAANSVDFRVGGTARSTLDRTPNALFDNVRVYDTVLTAGDIDLIRQSEVPEPGSLVLAAAAALFVLGRARLTR